MRWSSTWRAHYLCQCVSLAEERGGGMQELYQGENRKEIAEPFCEVCLTKDHAQALDFVGRHK